jgi:4'-phosphopantetheinyl transferase
MTDTTAAGTLVAGDVHVWRCSLDDDSLEQPHLLSTDELIRYGRLQSAASRRHYLATRVALRTVLAGYAGQRAEELAFNYNANGKPSLDGPTTHGLCFNISHSGPLGMLAVTSGAEVGIDVEWLHTQRDYLALARRFFSNDELQAIDSDSSGELFYRMWTMKEARVKLRGERLLAGLDKYRCRVDPDGRVSVVEHASRQTIEAVCDNQWLDPAGYVVAVAAACSACRVRRLVLN